MRLWSVWKGRQQIGFALGDANAAALKRAIDSDAFTFRVSSQPVPKQWAVGWHPVWKRGRTGPQWGAFLAGWNNWIAWQLQAAYGFTAASTNEDAAGTRVS